MTDNLLGNNPILIEKLDLDALNAEISEKAQGYSDRVAAARAMQPHVRYADAPPAELISLGNPYDFTARAIAHRIDKAQLRLFSGASRRTHDGVLGATAEIFLASQGYTELILHKPWIDSTGKRFCETCTEEEDFRLTISWPCSSLLELASTYNYKAGK